MAKKQTLTSIINTPNKKMDADEKIAAIAKIVAKARVKYGNTDAEISGPAISTCEGVTNLAYLSSDDKVAVAAKVIKTIRCQAIETTECQEGTLFDTEVARLIAINPVLVNLTATTDSEFI